MANQHYTVTPVQAAASAGEATTTAIGAASLAATQAGTARRPSSLAEGLDRYFGIRRRGSSVRQEAIGGITTFLAMVYAIFVVPGMLGKAGFDPSVVFIAVCLTSAFGSLLMGLWANLPIAIGCAISLTAFTAFDLVLGKGLSPAVALGAIFLMGLVFTGISVTGIRSWILRTLPAGVAHGTGVGIGLFLLLIASNSVGLVVSNPGPGLPVALGELGKLPALLSVIGLAAIFGLEQRRVPGGILLVILALSAFGLIFDPSVHFNGIFAIPSFGLADGSSIFGAMDLRGALGAAVIPSVLALVMTAVFDATGTIRAVAAQAGQLDDHGQIINGSKALTSDSVSSIFSALVGGAPAAAYIESAAGVAAGARTGLSTTLIGLLFLALIFVSPLAALVPSYATAPALMYVGLLMLSSIRKLNMDDTVDALAGLACAVFIVLTCNIVTGIMIGFCTLVIGRVVACDFRRLNMGTVAIAAALAAFYLGGWAI